MVDFIKSFSAGIDLAKVAESNRSEISAVFNELNAQIDGATNGRISIQREQFPEPAENPFLVYLRSPPKYWAISARHKIHKDAKVWELAKWYQGDGGYPCKITRKDEEMFCENKEALELALADLLREPSVGTILLNLLNFKAEVPPDSTPA